MRKNLLNNILNIGVDKNLINSQMKKVRLLNGLAFFGGFLLLFMSIILYVINIPYDLAFEIKHIGELFFDKTSDPEIIEKTKLIYPLINIFLSVSLLSILYLNYKRKYNISNVVIYLIAVISTYYFYFTQVNYAFFLVSIPGILSIIFYDKKAKYLSLFILNYIFFLFSTWVISKYEGFRFNGGNAELHVLLNFSIFYFIVYLIINRLKTENLMAEKRLHSQNNILNFQSEEIKQQSNELLNKNKALEEVNETKNKFFRIIAHDLRSPFNTILGISDLLLKEHAHLDDNERESLIKSLVHSSKGAYLLVENLLEWSEVQSEKFQCNPDSYNLSAILGEVLMIINDVAENKNIAIINEVSKEIRIYADKEMLKTILRNLILNAVKYTFEGGLVTINAQQIDNEVTISVADTGIGIEKEKIDLIFEQTQKFSTYGTDNEKGTGLGLVLCKEFVEIHNGDIRVESELGKGSVFSVSFPKNSK